MADVTMPQLGETVTEGTIIRWLKQVGEHVAQDEPLFEVSTDKVDSEVPSPASGVLSRIVVQEGETVDVGALLAVVGDATSAVTDAPTPTAEAPAPPLSTFEPPAPVVEAAPPAWSAPAPDVPAPAFESPPPAFEPPSPVFGAPASVAPSEPVSGDAAAFPPPTEPVSGDAAAFPPLTEQPASAEPAGVVSSSEPASNADLGTSMLLSPVVRRLVAEHGLDVTQIPGTGLGGRVTREDVLDYIDARAGATAPSPALDAAPSPSLPPVVDATPPVVETSSPVVEATRPPAPSPAISAVAWVPPQSSVVAPPSPASAPVPVEPPVPPAAAGSIAQSASDGPVHANSGAPAPQGERDEVIPFTTMRRLTAEHMIRSKAISAHTLVAREVDFENIERVRNQHKERFATEEGFSLTYLPFIARATVELLRAYPHLNSSVGDDALIVHRDVNLGIAVDLDREGLIVPVVHNADGHSLRGLARSVSDLSRRARSRKLSAGDITGGTFSITNAGPFGTLLTYPIIAQPQVAILATDGIKRRPVVITGVDGAESIAIHSVGVLGLAFDHRAVDGAYAASFLRDLAKVLETRDWAAEL